MAQPVTIMSYRKRLGKRGYTGIHISRIIVNVDGRPTERYLVEAVEPLAGVGVQCVKSLGEMATEMR